MSEGVNIGIPNDIKELYMEMYRKLKGDIPFSVFFESLVDYELLLLNQNGEYNEFRHEFTNVFYRLYSMKYAYNIDKDINQSVIFVKDYVCDKYYKWVNSYIEVLNLTRGISYTLLETIITVVGDEIEKDTRFKELLEKNFKKYYNFDTG